MKVNVRFTNPENEFLLGINLVDGIAENSETGESMEVNLLSLGFFLFEINIIWY